MPDYTLSKADRQYIYDAFMNSQYIKENPNSETALQYIEWANQAMTDNYMTDAEPSIRR